MKPWIIACIFLAILAVVAISSQRRNGADRGSNSAKSASSNLTIYDVRTPDEYAAGRVENASLLPLDDIRNNVRPAESTNTSIGVYCRTGQRSSEAVKLLKHAGYTNITDLGGLADVQRAGYKIIR